MTPQAPQRVRLIYTGDVQGVGFRMTAARLARPFPVTGFVRNRPDGAVHLEAQGAASDLEAFLDRLAREMAHHIHHTDRASLDALPDDAETDFAIRY